MRERTRDRVLKVRKDFLENAFQRRFQHFLWKSLIEKTWHIIAAVPGSGKSSGIYAHVHNSKWMKDKLGNTILTVLAAQAPGTQAGENALVLALCAGLGKLVKMNTEFRRTWLTGQLYEMGVEQIVIDDAHDLSLAQLRYLKELTDSLAAPPYGREVGLCLICASDRGVIPLKAVFDIRTELIWRQFKRRLDLENRYVEIANHSVEEVREICGAYEALYQDQLPRLQLKRWAKAIHTYVTNPVLDPEESGRATMHHIQDFLTYCLRSAYEQDLDDINSSIIATAGEVLIVGLEKIKILDSDKDWDGYSE